MPLVWRRGVDEIEGDEEIQACSPIEMNYWLSKSREELSCGMYVRGGGMRKVRKKLVSPATRIGRACARLFFSAHMGF
jgi:hypothetical protein